MKIVKLVKITQDVKNLGLALCAVLFLLPACKTSPADTPLSAAREGENAAVETAAEKKAPVPESLSEMPPETGRSIPPAGAETANIAGEPQPLKRIVAAAPAVENLNAESGSDRLTVSEPVPASEVKPAEGLESENKGKKSAKSAEKIEPAVKIVRASNTPAQASTPVPAQPPAREKGAASAGTANTKAQPTIISRTDAAPAQTSAGTASKPAAAQNSAQVPANTAASRPQATNSGAERIQPAAEQTETTAAGTKRAESADLSAESGFGLSSEPEVELASEDGAGSSSEAAVPAIVPRRSVNAKMNQFIDIPYSGRKWIFLGETEATSPPVVRFVNRTFSGDDTLFSVQAKNPGKTVLHFYRQDALENTYIDDYVAVEVLNEKAVGTNEHVRAAEIAFGKSASAEDAADSGAGSGHSSDAGKIAGNFPSASQTAVAKVSAADEASAQDLQSSNGISEKDSAEAEQLYAAAQKAFEEKRYQDSLTSLQEYEASAGEDSDKALILRARVYESDSELRNIKAALEAYEKIVNFFPESVFWDEAKRRSTYLRRFYFDIR